MRGMNLNVYISRILEDICSLDKAHVINTDRVTCCATDDPRIDVSSFNRCHFYYLFVF